MRTRLFAVALAACIPAAVFAQRSRGGSSDPTPAPDASASPSSSAKSPTSRDLADLNPAALLINKRKKVPLADSTVAQLKAVEKKINERNAQFFTTYDSVRKWTVSLNSQNAATQGFGLHGGVADAKIAAPVVSPAEQAKMQASMRDLRALMADYRERRKADVTDALAAVPDAGQKAATDLLGQQDGDLDRLLGGRP
jgi:hypothetical protein